MLCGHSKINTRVESSRLEASRVAWSVVKCTEVGWAASSTGSSVFNCQLWPVQGRPAGRKGGRGQSKCRLIKRSTCCSLSLPSPCLWIWPPSVLLARFALPSFSLWLLPPLPLSVSLCLLVDLLAAAATVCCHFASWLMSYMRRFNTNFLCIFQNE